MKNKIEKLNDEQRFPYEGMTLEERNYYLNIIKNCKDICDTENKVDNVSKCEIIELYFTKKDNEVNFNGSLTIGTNNKHENRSIEGYLYIEKQSVLVDYRIIRLCVDEQPKIYSVLDEFTIENNILKRRSQYNYNMISLSEEITDETMKGKLR